MASDLKFSVLESMPKVELHIHLEGAIPMDAMWALVQAAGGGPRTREELARRFEYGDFAQFLDTWMWKLRFHRTYDDYEFMAEAVARDLVIQNIVYVEMYVSPSDARANGLETGPLLAAVRRGLDKVEGVDVALVPDLVRNSGQRAAMRTLQEVIEVVEDAGIIGITIGGDEARYGAELFADHFARAGSAGLRLSAHAGEAAGPASVTAALDVLGVDRLGHGIRAVEDPGLVARLVVNRVPLEVCPTSNLRTGVATSWETHPVRTLIDVGAMVTINSDDPVMFDSSVARDLWNLHCEYGYGLDVLVGLMHNAIDASWADGAHKAALRERLQGWQESL
ncbi:MAG: adenosine deaminase [Acidimicrobiia bacterium]|nr:adenosine deaminase [Acidimicrobiia bacterium]